MTNIKRFMFFVAILCSFPIARFAAHLMRAGSTVLPAERTVSGSKDANSQGPLCGQLNDNKLHFPPDWQSFVPPSMGQSYVDPSFGCTIVRLTDARKEGVALRHYYATVTPVNADDSKILIVNGYGEWSVIDLLGNVIVPANKMPGGNAGLRLWDATDGNAFYFTRENSLMKGTIRVRSDRKGKKTSSEAVVESSAVHTFKEYEVVLLPDKSALSIDGKSFAMWGGKKGTDPLNIFTYNMQTNVKKPPYTTACAQNVSYVQGSCVHAITQTADDDVIIDFAKDGNCEECGNRFWNGSTLTHIQDATNHLDVGFDLSGNSIFIGMGNPRTLAGIKNPCESGWGLDVRRVNEISSSSCLLDKQPSWHVSYRGGPSQPWAVISFFDDRKPGPELFNDNKGFQEPSSSNWQLYEDEIILARIDAVAIYRLAHARSRSAEGFWEQPRAAISRDGRYVVFDSNMAYAQTGCPKGIESCTDVFMIQVR